MEGDHYWSGIHRLDPLIKAIRVASSSAPDAVLLLDAEGTIHFANPAWEELTAYPADAIIGKRLEDLPLQSRNDHPTSAVGHAIETREPLRDSPDRLGLRSGMTVPVLLCVDPINSGSGVTIVRIHAVDETRAPAGARNGGSSGGTAVWSWDLATGVITANQVVTELFGYQTDPIEGGPGWIFQHIHRDDRSRVESAIRTTAEGREDRWQDEFRFRTAEGSWLGVRGRGTLIRDDGGEPLRMIIAVEDATALNQLMAQGRRLEDRHRALTRALAQIVWTTRADGAVDDIPEWRAYTGQTLDEVRGYGWLNQIHPDDQQATMERWTRAVETRGEDPYVVSYRIKGADGEYRWFDARAVPIFDEAGEISEWVGVCVDVDAQKRAEREVIQREEQFRTLANSIPQLAWMADGNGWIFWYNRRWFDYTGTTLEEMEGWGWRKVHHPDHIDAVEARFRASIQKGESWEDTFPLRQHDGEYRWFLSRAIPIRDVDGRVVRWFGTNTDITEQREAQEERERLIAAIESERQRLEDVFRNAPAAIAVTLGEDHVFASANPVYRDLVGDRRMIGKPLAEVFHVEASRPLLDRMDHVYRTGRPFIGTEVQIQPQGDFPAADPPPVAWFNFVLQPLTDGNGEVNGILTHAVDVTAQVVARQATEAARVAAEEANQSKSDFLATMSHELRTPLNAMIGYTDLLEMGVPEPIGEKAAEQIGRISLSARHLLQLIEEILTFSRVEAGREELRHEEVQLSDVVEEVSAVIEPLARAKQLGFSCDLPEGTPAIRTDPGKLRQILINLLGNAVKFTEEGQVGLDIRPGKDSIRLEVWDTGIGISPAHLENIFEPFRQLETDRTRRPDGTGLGLSVSRRLADLMGARLTVESEEGVGSRFGLELPRD